MNKDKNDLQGQTKVYSINNLSSKCNENIVNMDLEIDINGLSFSNRTNSCFSKFFQEENLKLQQTNSNDTNNIISHNIPYI